jgi:predicted small secreted protein
MVSRLLASIAAAAALALTGCNTVAGAGKDIERGGQVIRDTAKDVQKRL